MPGSYLPTDIATEIANLQDRCRRLESYRASPPQLAPETFTEITASQDLAGTAAAPFTLTFTDIPHANVRFTLTKTAKVLILGHIAFAGQGGSSGYAVVHLTRYAQGIYPTNDTIGDTCAVGVLANGGSNFTSATPYIVETLAADSYYVSFRYRMSDSSVTTLNASIPVINVFQLGAATVAIP